MGRKSFELPYGHQTVCLTLPTSASVDLLLPTAPSDAAKTTPEGETNELVAKALAEPVAGPPLRRLIAEYPARKVTIITSDNTRPCPSPLLIPPLLEELFAAGVHADDITVVVALGLHRPLGDEELRELVGQASYDTVRVINHDPDDTVWVGTTAAGTPVELFRPVVEADVRICVGNIEFHYFAGYSGGAKSILPGCASAKTVAANHGLMVRPGARAGVLEGNPVRADIEEGVAMVGIDFILNVVVDGEHRIVAAVAGDSVNAHRQGCEIMSQRDSVAIKRRADVVVVSAGGSPSDVNLYQAQKALENARAAVREGGAIVWLAQCSEGFGNSTFEQWMRDADSPEQVLSRIAERFVLGGHKAAAIASVLKKAEVYLVSDMGPKLQGVCGIVGFDRLDEALEAALARTGKSPKVTVMPHGHATFPLAS